MLGLAMVFCDEWQVASAKCERCGKTKKHCEQKFIEGEYPHFTFPSLSSSSISPLQHGSQSHPYCLPTPPAGHPCSRSSFGLGFGSSRSGSGSGSGSGSDYVPQVHTDMHTLAENNQVQALGVKGLPTLREAREIIHTFLPLLIELSSLLGSVHTTKNQALHRTYGCGKGSLIVTPITPYINCYLQLELYFYSIIQPHTDLSKDMRLRSELGRHGYVSVLWEQNNNWEEPSIIAVSKATAVDNVKDRSFIWQMEPFEEVLKRFPK
ncbi:uncharacterized protein UHOD_11487 [Ustilago sp. UG-2017b]|nr:uncharacterized protein UHOD_11487 [Ustilago sp. UG-2017b]